MEATPLGHTNTTNSRSFTKGRSPWVKLTGSFVVNKTNMNTKLPEKLQDKLPKRRFRAIKPLIILWISIAATILWEWESLFRVNQPRQWLCIQHKKHSTVVINIPKNSILTSNLKVHQKKSNYNMVIGPVIQIFSKTWLTMLKIRLLVEAKRKS